jgi:DNA-binding MarR family transcriptional regulator
LERLGLVSRTPDPADGRASLLNLTDEGHRRYRRARAGRLERLRLLLEQWDRTDVVRLGELLHRLNELID